MPTPTYDEDVRANPRLQVVERYASGKPKYVVEKSKYSPGGSNSQSEYTPLQIWYKETGTREQVEEQTIQSVGRNKSAPVKTSFVQYGEEEVTETQYPKGYGFPAAGSSSDAVRKGDAAQKQARREAARDESFSYVEYKDKKYPTNKPDYIPVEARKDAWQQAILNRMQFNAAERAYDKQQAEGGGVQANWSFATRQPSQPDNSVAGILSASLKGTDEFIMRTLNKAANASVNATQNASIAATTPLSRFTKAALPEYETIKEDKTAQAFASGFGIPVPVSSNFFKGWYEGWRNKPEVAAINTALVGGLSAGWGAGKMAVTGLASKVPALARLAPTARIGEKVLQYGLLGTYVVGKNVEIATAPDKAYTIGETLGTDIVPFAAGTKLSSLALKSVATAGVIKTFEKAAVFETTRLIEPAAQPRATLIKDVTRLSGGVRLPSAQEFELSIAAKQTSTLRGKAAKSSVYSLAQLTGVGKSQPSLTSELVGAGKTIITSPATSKTAYAGSIAFSRQAGLLPSAASNAERADWGLFASTFKARPNEIRTATASFGWKGRKYAGLLDLTGSTEKKIMTASEGSLTRELWRGTQAGGIGAWGERTLGRFKRAAMWNAPRELAKSKTASLGLQPPSLLRRAAIPRPQGLLRQQRIPLPSEIARSQARTMIRYQMRSYQPRILKITPVLQVRQQARQLARTRPSTITEVIPKSLQRAATDAAYKQRGVLALDLGLLSKQRLNLQQGLLPKVRSTQLQRQQLITRMAAPSLPNPAPLVQVLRTPSPAAFAIPKNPPPLLPRSEGKSKQARLVKRYTPSFAALALGITGKALKGSLKGVELRPVPLLPRRRRRGKRR